MNPAFQHNLAAFAIVKRATAAAAAVAAGTGDATTTTGATIDRFGFSGAGIPQASVWSVLYDATLASGKTLSLAYAVQHSADGTNWSDYATGSSVVATGASGGSTAAGELNVNVDLGSARRYTRILTVPDLSATGTDTAVTRAVAAFGGFDRLPPA